VVIGHAIAFPPVRFGQIGYARRCPPQDPQSSWFRPRRRYTLYLRYVPVNRYGAGGENDIRKCLTFIWRVANSDKIA
jgi:hypothetical protein